MYADHVIRRERKRALHPHAAVGDACAAVYSKGHDPGLPWPEASVHAEWKLLLQHADQDQAAQCFLTRGGAGVRGTTLTCEAAAHSQRGACGAGCAQHIGAALLRPRLGQRGLIEGAFGGLLWPGHAPWYPPQRHDGLYGDLHTAALPAQHLSRPWKGWYPSGCRCMAHARAMSN